MESIIFNFCSFFVSFLFFRLFELVDGTGGSAGTGPFSGSIMEKSRKGTQAEREGKQYQ